MTCLASLSEFGEQIILQHQLKGLHSPLNLVWFYRTLLHFYRSVLVSFLLYSMGLFYQGNVLKLLPSEL